MDKILPISTLREWLFAWRKEEITMSRLRELIIEELQRIIPEKKATGCKSPEHKEYHCFGDSDCPECTQNVGFNDCIDLMKKRLNNGGGDYEERL